MNTKPCVAEAMGDGRARGDDVGSGVTVGRAVFVTVGAAAVCVWNTDATRVCAPAATVAFTSGVAWPAGGCPAHDARNIPMSNIETKDRRAKNMIHLMYDFG